VLHRPLIYRDGGEVGPAYGAARLAQLADTNARIEEVCAPPAILRVIEPDDHLTDHFASKISGFRTLYKQLKSSFQETL
jgi:xylulokinase